MITQVELVNQTKDEILSLLQEIHRPGIDKVIRYLNESTFFKENCNTHHTFRGGLAVHSLGVYKEMKKLNVSLPEDSIRIVALLHDICKSHHPLYDHIGVTYKNGKPYKHHGLRSVLLLEELGLQFHTGEYYAIEKHMHRIKDIPSSNTYDQRDMLRHYMHSCDHRDSATYPKGFDSYTLDDKKRRWFKIETLLYSTHRPGIEIVIDHLHRKDSQGINDIFFRAPASTNNHNNCFGGLAKHSLEVYQEAKAMYENLVKSGETLSFGMDSIILCCLLHDVCKMDEYVLDNGRSVHTKHYNGGNPHGMKSEHLLRRWHLCLNDEERKAIIWHMGDYAKDAIAENNTTYKAVAASSRLVELIHNADSIAAKKALKNKN
jgi:23S rRNA maturation-related 3'-5' exoribonuclease YhaM